MAKDLKAAIVGCGRMGGFIDDEMTKYPWFAPPYCHAGAYRAADETVLVAAADVVRQKVDALSERWNVPARYTDFREMILREKPDILSVCTRPENHAEICVFAAENGVKGIYCEKPLCCSMDEADAIRNAITDHKVHFNLGVNRRYQEPFWTARDLIRDGVIGSVQAVSAYSGGSALWTHTHTTDMLLYLAGDPEVAFAQGHANVSPEDFEDNRVDSDPAIHSAYFRFANGIHGTMVACSGYEFEAHGSKGVLRSRGNGEVFEVWVRGEGESPKEIPFPEHPRSSGAVNCVNDLTRAVLHGGTTLGNIEASCRGQEMILAAVESERLKGARIPLPMTNRSFYVGKW